jgi:hypothetical protein
MRDRKISFADASDRAISVVALEEQRCYRGFTRVAGLDEVDRPIRVLVELPTEPQFDFPFPKGLL